MARDRPAFERQLAHTGDGILILVLGMVKCVSAGKVYIELLITDMRRAVASEGAVSTIHELYRPEEDTSMSYVFFV